MLSSKICEFAVACIPPLGGDYAQFDKYVESNYTTGTYGQYVILVAILIHILVNQYVFRKFFTYPLLMYVVLIFYHIYSKVNFDQGDCGSGFAESTYFCAIFSIFWIIFAPLITFAIKKYRKFLKDKKNTSQPFAKPIEESTTS